MKNRLIVFTVLVTAVSLLAFFGFGILVTENQYYKQAEQKIIDIARIYAETYTDAESCGKKAYRKHSGNGDRFRRLCNCRQRAGEYFFSGESSRQGG